MTGVPGADWETVIGLEVHVQLATESKLFSSAPTRFGAAPNSQVAPLDAGLPGTLPVLNRQAVEQAIRLGCALNAQICPTMRFERKHYFYPDLPKGYQISQLAEPIVSGGYLDVEAGDGGTKRVRITRAHIEEDAGKSLHEGAPPGRSAIDLNRAGMPLLEVVTEPDLRSPQEAVAYLKQLHLLVRWLGVSRGHMAEGSMRCDANVSVRRRGERELGTRCEIKNLNSFRFVEQAVAYEARRQAELLEAGGEVEQQTRLYDEGKRCTRKMRGKEESADYRYFPEPDLLPIELDPEWISQIRAGIPELPGSRRERYAREMRLDPEVLAVLTSSRELGDYFEEVARACGDPRAAANWMAGPFTAALKAGQDEGGDGPDLAGLPLKPDMLGQLLVMLAEGAVAGPAAREVFEQLWQEGGDPAAIVEERGLGRIGGEDELREMARQVVESNPAQAQQHRDGKHKVMGFFVGQVMKATKGRADPKELGRILAELLSE